MKNTRRSVLCISLCLLLFTSLHAQHSTLAELNDILPKELRRAGFMLDS
jgi:hypothetical protein